MTNKPEMVRVPRELLERIVAVYASSPWPAWIELCAAVDAAPAEDVREVGEEPVAWMQFDGEGGYDFTDDCETGERWMQVNGPDWATPLYSHPQRPVVLPERSNGCGTTEIIGHGSNAKCGQKFWGDDVHFCEGCKRHNACIDEFERLNQ